jgi:hypothetical protein
MTPDVDGSGFCLSPSSDKLPIYNRLERNAAAGGGLVAGGDRQRITSPPPLDTAGCRSSRISTESNGTRVAGSLPTR